MTAHQLARRLPLSLIGGLVALGLTLSPWPRLFHNVIASEAGLIEIGTVLAALAGAALAIDLFTRRKSLPDAMTGWWFLAVAGGLVLLAGEELSWGQHLFRFGTPDGWTNQQGETNLHNVERWIERAPKYSLTAVVLASGLAWPLVRRMRGAPPVLAGWFGWLWPSVVIWPVAAWALVLKFFERLLVTIDLNSGPTRPQYVAIKEGFELLLIIYVLAYLWAVRDRLAALERAEGPGHSSCNAGDAA